MENNHTKNTFGKKNHLKSRKHTEQLFASGKSFFVHPIKVFWRLPDGGEELQKPTANRQDTITEATDSHGPYSEKVLVGVSASKRNFKKATDRNRVKRLLREAYRTNQQGLVASANSQSGQLHVFFIYVDKTLPTFALVEEKMLACLKKLQKILGEKRNEKLL